MTTKKCYLIIFSRNDTYVMYDIYNNAYTHGGKLHVEIKQYFIYNNDKNVGNLLLANQWEKPKSQNRTEMNDITFRVGAIVSLNYSVN